jgi:hypothetical protein
MRSVATSPAPSLASEPFPSAPFAPGPPFTALAGCALQLAAADSGSSFEDFDAVISIPED